jgi:hypothetical protein
MNDAVAPSLDEAVTPPTPPPAEETGGNFNLGDEPTTEPELPPGAVEPELPPGAVEDTELPPGAVEPELPPGAVDAEPAAASPPADLSQAFSPAYSDAQQKAMVDDLNAWKACARDSSPEHVLEVAKYVAATGKPAAFVEKALPQMRKAVEQTNLSRALMRAPGLARFVADSGNGVLAKDDTKALTQVEGGLRGDWHHITGAFVGGVNEQTYIALTNKMALGAGTPEDAGVIEEIEKERAKSSDAGWHWYSKWAPGLAGMLPYLGGATVSSIAGGGAGGFVGSAASPAGTAVGAVAGGVAANYAFNFFQNFGPTYWRLRNIKDEGGKQLIPDGDARAYAASASGIGALLMTGLTGKVLGKMPGMKSLTERLGMDIVTKAVKASAESGFAQKAAMLGIRYGVNLAEAGGMVAAQAVANQTAEEVAKAHATGGSVDLAAVATAGKDTFLSAMQDMAGIVALGAGRQFHDNLKQAHALQEGNNRLAVAVQGAKESKLLQRSPEKFEEFARLAQGDAPQDVFIDRAAFEKFAEKQGGVEEVTKALGTKVAESYAEAIATGGDIRIPMEKYLASNLTREAHESGLGDDVRLSQDALSTNQAKEAFIARAKEVADSGASDSSDKVYQDILEKLVAANSMSKQQAEGHASIWAASFSRLGENTGTDAWAQYRARVRVSIVGPDGMRLAEAPEASAAPESPEQMAKAAQFKQGNAPLKQEGLEPTAPGPAWYSAAEKAAEVAKQTKGDATSWLSVLSKTPGVKKEELDFIGLKEWLAEQKGAVPKEKVLEYIRAHQVEVTEKELGSGPGPETKRAQEILVRDLREEDGIEVQLDQLGGFTGMRKVGEPDFVAPRDFSLSQPESVRRRLQSLRDLRSNTHEPVTTIGGEPLVGRGPQDPLRFAATLLEGGYESAKAVLEVSLKATKEQLAAIPGKPPADSPELERIAFFEKAQEQLEAIKDKPIGRAHFTNSLAGYGKYRTQGEAEGSYRELLFYTPSSADYTSSHFSDQGKGLLAHARYSEHETEAGDKVFLVDEVQSDLHQQGREEGYQARGAQAAIKELDRRDNLLIDEAHALQDAHPQPTRPPEITRQLERIYEQRGKIGDEKSRLEEGPSVPDAPFKGGAWEEMVVKRMLRLAAEKGFKKMAWATGETQAERYGISSAVDRLTYDEESGTLRGFKEGEATFEKEEVKPEELASYVGGDVAKRLLEKKPQSGWSVVKRTEDLRVRFDVLDPHGRTARTFLRESEALEDVASYNQAEGEGSDAHGVRELAGLDLKTGGEGMKAAYDVRIPSIVKKLVKRYGGVMEKEKLSNGDEVHTVTLPEAFVKEVVGHGMPLFQEASEGTFTLEKKGERGYIQFSPADGSGKPRRFDIHLLKGADASTFAHETMHFLSEVMGDVAQLADASPELKADYQKMLEFMGHASHEERQTHAKERRDLSNKETRTPEEEARLKQLTAKEERITHAWEQYLLEGKAPSADLARPFARFRNWLTRIYKSTQAISRQYRRQYGEDIGLSDEVRGVFDRMLASSEEIQKAEAASGAQPFQEAKAFMSPAEQAEYDDVTDKARTAAEDDVLRRIVEGTHEENAQWLQDERTRMTADVETETDAHPVYRTLKALGEGSPLLQADDGQPMKLDRAALVRTYGPDFTRTIPKEAVAKKGEGGMPPDAVAEVLGWESGDAMVRALQAAEKRDAVVKAEVQKRMEEAYGPALLDNGQWLADRALDAVHSSAQARKVVLELNALRRQLDKSAADVMSGDKAELSKRKRLASALRNVDFKSAKETAEGLIATKTVGELTAGEQGLPSSYLRAERTAAKESMDAALKGKLTEAVEAKERQLLNMALYRRARDVRAEMQKATDKLRGTGKDAWRAYLGKADPVYRDAHDGLLQLLGLQEKEEGRAPPSMDALLSRTAADAQDLAFDTEAIKALAATPKRWEALTVDEARNVMDAVENIRAAARNLTTLKLGERILSKDAFFEEAEKAIAGLPTEPLRPRDKDLVTNYSKARGLVQHMDAILLNNETTVEILTGGKRDSVVHKLLVDGYLSARNKEAELGKQFLEGLMKKWETLPNELKDKRTELLDLGKELPLPDDVAEAAWVDAQGKLQRQQLWMIALNMGNDGNKQRLLDGYRWSEEQVKRVLDREMTKPEWDWVQGVWDSLEGLYPLIEEVHERETGLKPGKVVARPVSTPHGEYAGGYFPARYDDRMSELGARQATDAENVAQVMGNGQSRVAVTSGHAKARADKYTRPIELTWGTVPGHVSQVLHDVSFRSYVKETAGILLDPRMKTLMLKRMGEGYQKQLVPWLTSVATSRADPVASNLSTVLAPLGWLRGRMATQALGLNMAVALGDFSNPAVAIAAGAVKPSVMAHALGKTTAHWGEVRSFALENSAELRFRNDKIGKKLVDQLGDMGGKPKSPLERHINETAFVFMEWSDKLTATPMWFAKYQQELAEGRTHEDAARAGDDVIRKFFPAEHVSEGPAFTRNKITGAVVMFYGYMNKVYNFQRAFLSEATDKLRDEGTGYGTKAGAVAKAAGKLLATSIAVGGMSEFLSGRGREDDESWTEWLIRKAVTGPFNSLPLTGPIAEWAARRLGGHEGVKFSQRLTPGLATGQKVVESIGSMMDAAKGDEVKTKDILNGLELLGLGAGIPTRQIRKTGSYAVGLATGDSQPRGAADVVGGLIYGSREKQPLNPMTTLQDAVSE